MKYLVVVVLVSVCASVMALPAAVPQPKPIAAHQQQKFEEDVVLKVVGNSPEAVKETVRKVRQYTDILVDVVQGRLKLISFFLCTKTCFFSKEVDMEVDMAAMVDTVEDMVDTMEDMVDMVVVVVNTPMSMLLLITLVRLKC